MGKRLDDIDAKLSLVLNKLEEVQKENVDIQRRIVALSTQQTVDGDSIRNDAHGYLVCGAQVL